MSEITIATCQLENDMVQMYLEVYIFSYVNELELV